MNRQIAQAIFDKKYKEKLTWFEISSIVGFQVNRGVMHWHWKQYGIKIPMKYRRDDEKYEKLLDNST